MKKVPSKKAAKLSNFILFILFVITAAVAVICLNIPEAQMIAPPAGFFALIFLLIHSSQAKKIKRSYCRACAAPFDYDRDISWEEIDQREDGNALVSTVEFTCVCPACGKEHIFRKKFEVARRDSKTGQVKYSNIKNLARKTFYNT